MTAAGGEPADWISHDVYRTTPTAAPHTEPRPDAEPVRLPQDADLTTALPVRLPRFGQLTHTNFHAANGNGGWQVKEATGGITGDEERLLETRTAGFPPGELSKLRGFLGQADVDRLPRRLVYGLVDPSRPGPTAYWHAVPAGIDSSGRPGNVFTHVLIDRAPEAPQPPLRPGDLLRSPVWLRPYNAEQVFDAALTGVPDPPWPGPVIDRAAVLDFLVDKARVHGGTLRGLLDAVHAAMRQQGPMVVLGVVDLADADRWTAAAGHLMSPGTSRRLYFSTVEHVGGLAAAHTAGLHLVVVPAPALRSVEPDGTVVLISDEDLTDGHPPVEFVDYDVDLDAEQVHVTAYGSRIRATPWSMVAAAIMREPALAAELLHRQDEIAAMVGDRDLGCAWPLALAVVEHGPGHADPGAAEVIDEILPAARMIVRQASLDVAGTPVQQIVERLREEALGRTAADAWTVLQGKLPPGLAVRTATAIYLKRAVQDRHWLLRDGGVPLPDLFGLASQIGDTVVVEAHAALGNLAAEQFGAGGNANPESAAVALRLLDLVARAGLVAHLDRGRLGDALDRVVGPVLLHPLTGPELVDRVGPLTESAQTRIVRPWLDRLLPQLPGRPGCRLTPLVLRWLFPEPPVLPPATSIPPPTMVEAAAQATLVLRDPSAYRPIALMADLGVPTSGPTTRAALGPGLPADAVVALLDRVEPRRLVAVLRPTLLSAPAGADLDALLDRLRWAIDQPGWDTPDSRAVRDARELRDLELNWHLRREGDDPQQPAFRRFARLLRPLVNAGEPLAKDLLASGTAADVVDRIHGSEEPLGTPLAQQRRTTSSRADADAMVSLARRVAHAVGAGATTDRQVVLAAQLGGRAVGGTMLGPASWTDLPKLCWTTPSGRPHVLLDHIVYLRLSELQHKGPDEIERLVAGAKDWVERAIEERRDHFELHRTLADYDRVALAWWRRVGVQEDDARRVLRRRGRWSI